MESEQTQELKSIVHDLSNSLTAAMGTVEVFIKKNELTEEQLIKLKKVSSHIIMSIGCWAVYGNTLCETEIAPTKIVKVIPPIKCPPIIRIGLSW